MKSSLVFLTAAPSRNRDLFLHAYAQMCFLRCIAPSAAHLSREGHGLLCPGPSRILLPVLGSSTRAGRLGGFQFSAVEHDAAVNVGQLLCDVLQPECDGGGGREGGESAPWRSMGGRVRGAPEPPVPFESFAQKPSLLCNGFPTSRLRRKQLKC